MELRKLQLVGRASFSVTLPPDWIKENKLKPSDQITITLEDDGSLRLTPGIIPEGEGIKITIDADRCKNPRLLRRLIVGAYLRGGDSIEVVSKRTISENHRKEIRDAVDSLMGLGIIESTSDHVTIQSMVNHSKFQIIPLLKRLCDLASSIYEDALRALSDRDSSLAADIIHRENEVNKIFSLAQRQFIAAILDKSILKKVGLKGVPEVILYRAVSVRMKSIADSAGEIANNQLALGQKKISYSDLQNVTRLGKMAREIACNACEAFFKGNIVLANNTVEAFNRFEKTKDELIKEMGPRIKDVQVAMCLMTIIRDLRRIADDGKLIGEITIDSSAVEKRDIP